MLHQQKNISLNEASAECGETFSKTHQSYINNESMGFAIKKGSVHLILVKLR
jgi:hypothetical protein